MYKDTKNLGHEMHDYNGNTWSHGNGKRRVNLLKPTGYVMHQQFNIQQL